MLCASSKRVRESMHPREAGDYSFPRPLPQRGKKKEDEMMRTDKTKRRAVLLMVLAGALLSAPLFIREGDPLKELLPVLAAPVLLQLVLMTKERVHQYLSPLAMLLAVASSWKEMPGTVTALLVTAFAAQFAALIKEVRGEEAEPSEGSARPLPRQGSAGKRTEG